MRVLDLLVIGCGHRCVVTLLQLGADDRHGDAEQGEKRPRHPTTRKEVTASVGQSLGSDGHRAGSTGEREHPGSEALRIQRVRVPVARRQEGVALQRLGRDGHVTVALRVTVVGHQDVGRRGGLVVSGSDLNPRETVRVLVHPALLVVGGCDRRDRRRVAVGRDAAGCQNGCVGRAEDFDRHGASVGILSERIRVGVRRSGRNDTRIHDLAVNLDAVGLVVRTGGDDDVDVLTCEGADLADRRRTRGGRDVAERVGVATSRDRRDDPLTLHTGTERVADGGDLGVGPLGQVLVKRSEVRVAHACPDAEASVVHRCPPVGAVSGSVRLTDEVSVGDAVVLLVNGQLQARVGSADVDVIHEDLTDVTQPDVDDVEVASRLVSVLGSSTGLRLLDISRTERLHVQPRGRVVVGAVATRLAEVPAVGVEVGRERRAGGSRALVDRLRALERCGIDRLPVKVDRHRSRVGVGEVDPVVDVAGCLVACVALAVRERRLLGRLDAVDSVEVVLGRPVATRLALERDPVPRAAGAAEDLFAVGGRDEGRRQRDARGDVESLLLVVRVIGAVDLVVQRVSDRAVERLAEVVLAVEGAVLGTCGGIGPIHEHDGGCRRVVVRQVERRQRGGGRIGRGRVTGQARCVGVRGRRSDCATHHQSRDEQGESC